ncbi:hypothetical protein D9613_010844 [Agrocybe pediades]|uniref:Heterokaryon incompatibility domain-containing protein n=1 Tax=Agrocybe pediades TaxID=84607 RepID=A0A8H4VMK4_9AGAR|nr:hypothetical protein D9613_010844 [Agrocybe pediades]
MAEPLLQIDPHIKALACDACWASIFSYQGFQKALASEHDHASGGYSYETTQQAINASATQGCQWCKLFASKDPEKTGPVSLNVTFSTEKGGYTPAGIKKLEVKNKGSYRLYTDAEDNASGVIRARDRILQINTPASYVLALKCLNNRLQNHDECPPPPTSRLPDRVIDCSNLDRPKLVLTDGMAAGEKYATLSYVWGKTQNLVTTTKNVDAFVEEGIPFLQFPRTIRDAMAATSSLGIRYLWVDALCILQDSAEDKGKQLANMKNIYTDSYVTLIAACSDGVDEGFLHDRPARIPAARVPFVCADGKVGSVCLASTSMVGYDVQQMYHDEMEPTNYRGWCLQERVLSERSFVFASDTLKYQCQRETVNIGDAFCEPSTGPRLPRAFASNVDLKSPSKEERMWARRYWLYTIWEYSRRLLTRPDEDKLSALAGIAEQYAKISKSRYCAGLWEATMLEDLLWKRNGMGERQVRGSSEKYRAPSWSWAAIDAHTDAPNFESKLEEGKYDVGKCEVVECQVSFVYPDAPFAAVSAARLKLKGFVHDVRVELGQKGNMIFLISTVTLDVADAEPTKKEIGSVSLDCVEESLDDMKTVVVPILWDHRAYSWVEALVFTQAENRADGVFRRVGHLYAKGDMNWVDRGEESVITIV